MQPPFAQPHHSKPRRRARWWIILLLVAIGGGLYLLLHSTGTTDKNGAKRPQASITVAATARKDIPVYLAGLGTVQAFNTVTVHSQVDGQLMAIKFREGQMVHAGDVLAQIDPRTFKAQYDQAIANKARDNALLTNARLDLKRYENLGDSVARQVLDTQRATVHQLEATVNADAAAAENAKAQLSYTTIASPIDGRTGIRQVDVGNIVHPGDASGLVVVTQLEPISVIFSLPQQNLEAINAQLNQPSSLVVEALASDNHTVNDSGVLELVDNQIDQTTGTIKLKATFPNKSHLLWPGGFTNVRLLLSTQSAALTVPVVAIQHGPQGAYVFVYQPADGTVAVKQVTVGIVQDQDAVISDGLADDDQVVTDGMAKLQDKSHVILASAVKADSAKPDATAVPAAAPAPPEGADEPKKQHSHKHGDGA